MPARMLDDKSVPEEVSSLVRTARPALVESISPEVRYAGLDVPEQLLRIQSTVRVQCVDVLRAYRTKDGQIQVDGPNNSYGIVHTKHGKDPCTIIHWVYPYATHVPEHWHEVHKVLVCLEGSMRVTGSNWQSELHPHESLPIDAYKPHAIDVNTPSKLVVVFFPAHRLVVVPRA